VTHRTGLGMQAALAAALVSLWGCHKSANGPGSTDGGSDAGSAAAAAHSSSMALGNDGGTLYVANADLDSVSVIDAQARTLTREILLGAAHPAVDADAGTYLPLIGPRALALAKDEAHLYASGWRSGMLYEIDLASAAVSRSVAVGSEPVGVLVSADGASIFVACSQDSTVVKVDVATFAVTGTAAVAAKPWSLAWSADGAQLFATHLLGPGATPIDPATMDAGTVWTIPDTAPRGDKRLAHGQVRGIYDAQMRPGSGELWTAHLLLGTDTAQPQLDFESTVFAAFSMFSADGSYQQTLSTNASDIVGINGELNDVVSGPHALAFTRDGRYALVVDSNSADLLAIDAAARTEATLLRPLPGRLPEGIALSPDETYAYIDERNSNDVAVVKLDRSSGALALSLDGNPIPRSAADPMPAQLRLGQHLFYSADSSEYAITKDHWVSCASCHIEGRSDAVVWLFAQGPRDTPSNAGGSNGIGFLFATADRNRIQDYWHTINIEQGGNFDPNDAQDSALLDALAAYVNLALPPVAPPTTDPALVAQGKAIFNRPDVGCSGCHTGPRYTDSGEGNPTLDLEGALNLHDVGTCNTGAYPDVAHEDVDGGPRAACLFKTRPLNGIADSAPYFHDGSAATLLDALEKTRGKMGDITSLSQSEEAALVEYLRSL